MLWSFPDLGQRDGAAFHPLGVVVSSRGVKGGPCFDGAAATHGCDGSFDPHPLAGDRDLVTMMVSAM